MAHAFAAPNMAMSQRAVTNDAQFRAAVDSAFAAGWRAHAEIVGPCMDSSPRFGGCTPMHCELPAGHVGAHTFLSSSWTRSADWRAGHAAGYDEGRDDGEGGAYTACAHPGRSTDDA
jgi:hypothetical protein